MKKSLLTCILLLGVFTFLSAQTRTTGKTKARSGKVKTQKKKVVTHKKKKVTVSRSSASARNAVRNRKTYNTSSKHKPVEKKNYVETIGQDEMSIDFASNRGKMLWPVEGTVSIPFGIYTIEETKIRGNNPGITIATQDKKLPVKSVFDGVVCNVDEKGEVATVYIRHGKYYTVYSNLSAIHVKKGDTVKEGEKIGEVGEAYGAPGGELTFVVMNDTKNVNPMQWLNN
jgi:murein hydrolase activator